MVRGYICRTHGGCYVTKRNVESSACLTQGAIGITLKRVRKLPLFIVQPDQLHILGTFTGQSNLNSAFRFRHNECYVPFIRRISTLLVFASMLRFPPFGRIIWRVPNFTGQFPTDLLGYTSCYSRFADNISNEKIFANIWIHVQFDVHISGLTRHFLLNADEFKNFERINNSIILWFIVRVLRWKFIRMITSYNHNRNCIVELHIA